MKNCSPFFVLIRVELIFVEVDFSLLSRLVFLAVKHSLEASKGIIVLHGNSSEKGRQIINDQIAGSKQNTN